MIEIWSSESDNLIHTANNLDDALDWARKYWLFEGNDSLDALSIDTEKGEVIQGPALRDLIKMGPEDPRQFLIIASYDWLVTKSGDRLHAPPRNLTEAQRELISYNWMIEGPVEIPCGRTVTELSIPGMFTRMSAQRCEQCCKVTGMPAGQGSPKNDHPCRLHLGLT